MNLRNHLQHQMLCQCRHLWPVFDIRAKFNLYRRICHTLTIENTMCINTAVKEILRIGKVCIHIRCRRQISLIRCSGCNRTGIHQCYGSDLSTLQLAAFTVREVSGRVTNRKCIIRWCITGTKTWSTERRLHNSSCLNQICQTSIFSQFHIDRCTCRINT